MCASYSAGERFDHMCLLAGNILCIKHGAGFGRGGGSTGVVCLSKGLSVGGEEVSGRGERGQTPGHIGQEREVRETLDVRFELFPHLGHPRQFLFIFLQRTIVKTQHGRLLTHNSYHKNLQKCFLAVRNTYGSHCGAVRDN